MPTMGVTSLADHTTQLRNFTEGEIREVSAFSCHLVIDQALSNLIVCLMITQTLQTNIAQTIYMLQWILCKFDFSQKEFEMTLTKTFYCGGNFRPNTMYSSV